MDIKLFHKSKGNEGSVTYNEAFHALNITIICYRYRGSRGNARQGKGKVIPASKPESLPILVLETVTFLLASIYRGSGLAIGQTVFGLYPRPDPTDRSRY